METIEGNKLIAEFMGLKTVKKLSPLSFEDVLFIKVYNDATKIWDNELPRYDSSWDWLMPVYQKVANAWFNLSPKKQKEIKDIKEALQNRLVLAELNSVWEFIIAFIQWYKTNKDL